jgi:exopolysaccharide biosynthesis polyprenyl glycosylphosphotransferase
MQTTADAEQSPTVPGPELIVEELDETPAWQQAEAKTRALEKHNLWARMRGQDWIVTLFYMLSDIVCWVLFYGIVGYVRRDAFFASPFEFFLVDGMILIVILQALYIIGGYDRNTETRSLTYTAEHILAVVSAAVISSLIIYSAATIDASIKPSRGVLLVSFAAFLPVSLLYRRFFREGLAATTAQRAFLVVGSGPLAAEFYEAYRNSPNRQRLEFVDIAQERVGQPIAGQGSPIVEGDIRTKLERLSNRYSGVILAENIDRLGPDLLARLVRTQFQRARVYTVESFYEAHWRKVPVRSIDPFWPLQAGFQLARISPYHYVKRLFDIVLSGLLLVICSPLIGLVGCLIWLTSGRPALFRQTRVGREGHVFTAYKFRTMFMRDPNEADIDIYTRHRDPRVTRLGYWLRKLRLDELPQLWNVFNGEMSLIGPRAEWTKCVEQYEKKIPFYHFRHLVKPGITGWAQVNYPYGESEEDAIQKLKYDLYYIRHYSLKLDAMIVLKTIHTILFGKGR